MLGLRFDLKTFTINKKGKTPKLVRIYILQNSVMFQFFSYSVIFGECFAIIKIFIAFHLYRYNSDSISRDQ